MKPAVESSNPGLENPRPGAPGGHNYFLLVRFLPIVEPLEADSRFCLFLIRCIAAATWHLWLQYRCFRRGCADNPFCIFGRLPILQQCRYSTSPVRTRPSKYPGSRGPERVFPMSDHQTTKRVRLSPAVNASERAKTGVLTVAFIVFRWTAELLSAFVTGFARKAVFWTRGPPSNGVTKALSKPKSISTLCPFPEAGLRMSFPVFVSSASTNQPSGLNRRSGVSDSLRASSALWVIIGDQSPAFKRSRSASNSRSVFHSAAAIAPNSLSISLRLQGFLTSSTNDGSKRRTLVTALSLDFVDVGVDLALLQGWSRSAPESVSPASQGALWFC